MHLVQLRLEPDSFAGQEAVTFTEYGLALHPGETGHDQRLRTGRLDHDDLRSESATLLASVPPGSTHSIYPPKWLGWSLVSVGSVLILYSLALKKPGG